MANRCCNIEEISAILVLPIISGRANPPASTQHLLRHFVQLSVASREGGISLMHSCFHETMRTYFESSIQLCLSLLLLVLLEDLGTLHRVGDLSVGSHLVVFTLE